MSQASALEQQMLELVNAERAEVGVAPLTFNNNLNLAAENHSSWMLDNDIFNHQGVDGTAPADRVEDAGYVLEGASAVGENIGWHSKVGDPGLSDDVELIHENLMNSPSHRDAILNPMFTEIGIGIEEGEFFTDGRDWDSVMVTQNFGTTEAESSAPADIEEDDTTDTPEVIATVEDPETPNLETQADDDDTEAATDSDDTEQPQDMSQPPENATDTPIFAGYDWDAFVWGDWLDLDFINDLPTGSGNNNGNGNTGDGINGQGNGFGNTGTGVNGTGNGNGNSDWWNAQFMMSEAAPEQDGAAAPNDPSSDWSWDWMDFANVGSSSEVAMPFDDCFAM
ncbi:CAP domain-containing protein [Phaeobacter sp. C3_T13_0]|uniref:CAP domain-containing protein n=1 Tax=Phaeobacter cretensis TaxID=3342641 RepID=UPI0039BC2D4A